jgi:hypothetical protein
LERLGIQAAAAACQSIWVMLVRAAVGPRAHTGVVTPAAPMLIARELETKALAVVAVLMAALRVSLGIIQAVSAAMAVVID